MIAAWQTCYRIVTDPNAVWCDGGLTDCNGAEFPFGVSEKPSRIRAVVHYFDERVIESESELSDSLITVPGTLTLSARATQLLHQLAIHGDIEECPTEILNKRGELLAEWSTFFALNECDALNHERSVLELAAESNTVTRVHSWSFDSTKLPDVDLFLSPPFAWIASEQMRKAFAHRKIRGVRFVPLWSAKKGPILQRDLQDAVCVDVCNTRIQDEGLSALRYAINLQTLNAEGSRVSDFGVRCLANLPHLKVLKLGDTAVGDKALEALRSSPSISVLSVPRTNVTDGGLVYLSEYPRLRIVDLEGTAVADSGVESLCRIKRLQRLNIRNTAVTDVGAARLVYVFPRCEIVR